MRVALLRFSTSFGGVESYMLSLGSGLRERGVDVHVVVKDRAFAHRAAAAGLEPHVVTKKSKWDPAFLFRLRGLLRRLEPDIVHSQGMVSDFAASFGGTGTPVITLHTLPEADASMKASRLLLYRAMNRIAFGRCALMIAVSKARRDDLLRTGVPPEKIRVVHNGIAPAPAAGRRGRPPGAPLRISSVSRLVTEKGIDVLIDGAAIAMKGGLKAALGIYGDGPERAALKNRAAERGIAAAVSFEGFREDVAAVLAGTDIIVLPSYTEGLPYILLEAAREGAAIAASSAGGIPEFVRDRREGLLFSPGSAEELARALQELAGDAGLRKRLADGAKERLAEGFTLDKMVSRTLAVYEEARQRES